MGRDQGVLGPGLEFPAQERHRPVGADLEEVTNIVREMGTSIKTG